MRFDYFDGNKFMVVMVGLPARGKTHTAQKLARYLSWLGYNTRIFNVGDYRRARRGAWAPEDFFDPTNALGNQTRLLFAMEALEDALAWLQHGGQVAVYDATNTTRERRRAVAVRCERAGVKVRFIETICNDRVVIETNIRETKLGSPDYEGFDPDAAADDFRQRIHHYERAYEPLESDEGSYIKLIDFGRQVVVNRIFGHLGARLVYFLMNVHTVPRQVWLTRHGESEFNTAGRIGGDAGLTERGRQYARNLADEVRREFGDRKLWVWTSTLRRTIETAEFLPAQPQPWRLLDEIDAGVCDGMTYEEIEREMPEEFAARKRDKFRYRYPRGESYEDVIARTEPVMIEMERRRSPMVVIAHQAVVRVLYAYLMDKSSDECAHLSMPLHTVFKICPRAYGNDETREFLGP